MAVENQKEENEQTEVVAEETETTTAEPTVQDDLSKTQESTGDEILDDSVRSRLTAIEQELQEFSSFKAEVQKMLNAKFDDGQKMSEEPAIVEDEEPLTIENLFND